MVVAQWLGRPVRQDVAEHLVEDLVGPLHAQHARHPDADEEVAERCRAQHVGVVDDGDGRGRTPSVAEVECLGFRMSRRQLQERLGFDPVHAARCAPRRSRPASSRSSRRTRARLSKSEPGPTLRH